MLQNIKEAYAEILQNLTDYKGQTFDDLFEDVFDSDERNIYYDQAKKDLANFELDDSEYVESSGDYTGPIGAVHYVADKMNQEGLQFTIDDVALPTTIANRVDYYRANDAFQKIYDDNDYDPDTIINNEVIENVSQFI